MIYVDPRLYVEIVPMEGPRAPRPDPVEDGHFDVERVYRVLGAFTASESGEAYLILSNPKREIWFISNRHVRAYGLFDGDALSLAKGETPVAGGGRMKLAH